MMREIPRSSGTGGSSGLHCEAHSGVLCYGKDALHKPAEVFPESLGFDATVLRVSLVVECAVLVARNQRTKVSRNGLLRAQPIGRAASATAPSRNAQAADGLDYLHNVLNHVFAIVFYRTGGTPSRDCPRRQRYRALTPQASPSESRVLSMTRGCRWAVVHASPLTHEAVMIWPS